MLRTPALVNPTPTAVTTRLMDAVAMRFGVDEDLADSSPGLPVVVLGQYVEQLCATELLSDRSEALGCRIMAVGQFVANVRHVDAGSTIIDPDVVTTLLARRQRDPRPPAPTPCEREAPSLMAQARSHAAITAFRCRIRGRRAAHHRAVTEVELVVS